MACMTFFPHPLAIATTQLVHVVEREPVSTHPDWSNITFVPLRTSWVVATDHDGNNRLQMEWGSA